MKKILFIDFDDSFSFNVIQELEELDFEVKVLNWKDFEEVPTEDILVLGPGPGSPNDYERIFPLVRECLGQKKPFLGLCLGHQIFWQLQGFTITRSAYPLHGQKIQLSLPTMWSEWLKVPIEVGVQRYNSLAVIEMSELPPPDFDLYSMNGEIIMSKGPNVITYQFHPESMGTSFRQAFFRPLLTYFV